ncbi:class B sortase [Olsenella sp. TM06-36]|uniref:class B sortase n=1 Tax=Olsenella sp. TM06-36 TaxID=2292361 RepID=UPI000E45012F|nr:class B sortase [Olsenella sp. TM06-36]RGJ47619.1 class B sortase [Olsenella sp. TM06-36]
MRERTHGHPQALTVVLLAVGVALLAAGVLLSARDGQSADELASLAETTHATDATPQGDAAGIDWDALESQNPDTVAWLQVSNTTVNVPVVQSSAEDPDRYLYLDFWGEPSDTGCPYLDSLCDADGTVMVVYGHRTLYRDYMFHDLSGAFEQGTFDTLGPAKWSTPAGGDASLAPLCSASVDRWDAAWQSVAKVRDVQALRVWLDWAASVSRASNGAAGALASSATRALVLVTCNGRAFHPETRTVTVFVSTSATPCA